MKEALRAITPPLLWNAAKSFSGTSSLERTFRSWDEAAASAGAYSDKTISEIRAVRAALNRSLGRTMPLEGVSLYWLTEFLHGDITVVDFGGATGEYGEALCLARPTLNYVVVENPTLVALMRPIGRVSFTTETPEACDIFYTSSTLQYLSNPYEVLDAGFQSAASAVVLARNSLSDQEIFRAQRSLLFANGEGAIPPGYKNTPITYPHRTIIEDRVHAIANRRGFRLVARTPEDSGVLPYHDAVYGMQLTFLKSTIAP